MTIQETIAKLAGAPVKTLTDARAALAESVAGLTAAAAQIGELEARALAAELKLSDESAKLATSAADLVSVNAKLTESTEAFSAVTTMTISALSDAGLKVEKLDADSIKSAAKSRAEAMGHELLAARGIKPLPEQIKVGENSAAAPLTDSEILAAYEAMPVGPARVSFLAKHEAAIWRAFSK